LLAAAESDAHCVEGSAFSKDFQKIGSLEEAEVLDVKFALAGSSGDVEICSGDSAKLGA